MIKTIVWEGVKIVCGGLFYGVWYSFRILLGVIPYFSLKSL